MNKLEEKLFGDLNAWLEKHVSVKLPGAEKGSNAVNKADLLEHLLERYRLNQKRLDNSVSFEDALNWECYADEDQLVLSLPDKPSPTLGKGSSPFDLQLTLLSYLLSQHGKRKSVYQTIEGFIKREWDYLLPEDFKKTRTGVYRCFTNTRFAAKALREEGLLKYGQGEAFKTWELTFFGVLVAACSRGSIRYYAPHKIWKATLNHCVAHQRFKLRDFAHCESVLRQYCAPMADHYESYPWMLATFNDLLTTYNEELSRQGRCLHVMWELTPQLLEQFEQAQGFDSFLTDFIEHLEIDRLLNGQC